jgi:hypothetical protein
MEIVNPTATRLKMHEITLAHFERQLASFDKFLDDLKKITPTVQDMADYARLTSDTRRERDIMAKYVKVIKNGPDHIQ